MAIAVSLLKCYQMRSVDCTTSCLVVKDMVKVSGPKGRQNNIFITICIIGNIELFSSSCCALVACAVSVSQVVL